MKTYKTILTAVASCLVLAQSVYAEYLIRIPITIGGPAPAPSIALSRVSWDAGSIVIGESASSSITVSNNGSATGNVSVVSPGAPFVASHDCPASLGASDSCLVSIGFHPENVGLASGAMLIAGSAISLSGAGALAPAPNFQVSTTTLSFGSVGLGISTTRDVTVSNIGDAQGSLSITPPAGDFTTTHSCPSVLNPNENCVVTVSFEPGLVGAASGSVSIAGTSVALGGTGATNLKLHKSTLEYFIEVGKFNQQPVFVTNVGSVAESVPFTLPSGEFEATHNCPALLNAGAICSFSVKFQPLERGNKTGSMTIAGAPVSLMGTAFGPDLQVDRTSMNFGEAFVGETLTMHFTLENKGNGTARNISYTLPTGAFSARDNCLQYSEYGPDYKCLIEVSFHPSAAGVVNGSMIIDGKTISFSGIAVGTQIAFGNVKKSAGIQVRTFTLTSAVSARNTNAGVTEELWMIDVQNNCPRPTMAVGQSCTISLRLDPEYADIGPVSGALYIGGVPFPITVNIVP